MVLCDVAKMTTADSSLLAQGYFLLYESMLPSVLVARNRYLNPTTGTLAPSHCRMLLAGVSDAKLLHSRIRFWEDVHGFTMPAMRRGLEDEAYTETLGEDKVVTSVDQIYDLPLQTMEAKQPAFVSQFRLEGKEKDHLSMCASFTPECYLLQSSKQKTCLKSFACSLSP